ncbi:hypothetical protein ACHWQZ_G003517 [Mnemiopsis leidyi]
MATNGQTIDNTEIVKDLGIYISNDCSWTHHINTAASSARKMASWILGAFRDRSALTTMTLFKSLVRSKLEYCCLVWSPTKITEIQTLENVEREFTRRIVGMKDSSYWERLKKLKLISLQRRRERYIIIHTWKIMKNMVPNGMSLQFTTNERLGNKIKPPKFPHKAQRSAVSSAYESFYNIKAALLWNILPKSVNSAESLGALKSELSRFMDQYPDMTPVTGYAPPNSNSLIDWRNSGGHGPTCRIEDIEFSTEDIMKAIDEIDTYSSTSHECIPACILKACKEPLSFSIHILWEQSFSKGAIPQSLKEQFIARSTKRRIVTVDGVHSELTNVWSGVPQGTVLGPLLFLIHINDLEEVVHSSTAASFADDTRLTTSISQEGDTAQLQDDLNRVVEWFIQNNMVLHEGKFEYLCYRTGSSKWLQEMPFTCQQMEYITPAGFTPNPEPSVWDLGVTLTPDCHWSTYIHQMAVKVQLLS